MSCHGANALNPICRLHDAATAATTDAFTNIAGWFGQAAADTTTWLWAQIGSATTIDLSSPHLAADLAATGAIAGVLCLALFCVQVITGVLRRDPGALGRATKGLMVALVASVFALAVTKILLGVVDSLSEGVVAYAMNTTMEGLGRQLALGSIATAELRNPAVVLLFSIVILAAVVVVWAAMMIRKMMVIIAAVLTPLAFSGATADITRSWVRKWIEFMAAMIVSKLLLVIILMVGISVVEGAGQVAHPGPGQVMTQLASGSLILLMGGFAPWVAIKMFHFTGDALHSAHLYAGQASAGARTVISAPQKINNLHSQASSAVSKLNRSDGHGQGHQAVPPRNSSEVIYDRTRQIQADGAQDGASTTRSAPGAVAGRTAGAGLTCTGTGAGAAGGSAAGAGATGAGAAEAGAAVAAPVVVPAVVAGATVSAARTAAHAADRAATRATGDTQEASAEAAPASPPDRPDRPAKPV